MPRTHLLQFRRGAAADWTSVNPVLAAGEPGVEKDTGKIKIGDGVAAWTALPYSAAVSTSTILNDFTDVDTATVAPIDGNALIYEDSTKQWKPRAHQIERISTMSSAPSGAYTVPEPTTATIHNVTMTASYTFTFPALGAGKSFLLLLTQDATGNRGATWPPEVRWPNATAPSLTTTPNKTDILSFICPDGTFWYGNLGGKNYG